MCNGTSCSLLLKKKKPLFELETRSSKHTIMHKKVRIITPQQAYTTGRMEVLYRVFVRKYIGKNKVKLDTKSGKYYDTQKA